MNARDVLVTVVLPVFNGEAYLSNAIESILSQSYRDFEFLILDDGSDDSTPSILAQYARRDTRIRVLRHENRGVGYTLNRGVSESRGRLIALIAADDVAMPHRLRKQVDFFTKNPDYVLVGGYLRLIDSSGSPIGIRRYPTSDEQLRARIVLYNPVGDPSVMYRRDDVLAVGGYTSRFSTCEDYDLLLRLAKRGKLANLPEPLTLYRLHAGSTKSQHTLRSLRDTVLIKRTAFAEYGYRETVAARAVNLAQNALARLPAMVAYRLFRMLFIRSEARRARV